MAKYGKPIVKKITDLIKADSYTIAEICSLSDISEETFHKWKREKPEFSDAVSRAREAAMQNFVKEAKNSLMKKLTGYTVEESKTVYVDDGKDKKTGKAKAKIKEQTKITKHIQPDTNAIIFTLTNGDPDNWKNRQNNEVTGKDGKDLIPARVLTKKEAAELLKSLENEC